MKLRPASIPLRRIAFAGGLAILLGPPTSLWAYDADHGSGAPGPHVNVYGEFYNPVYSHTRDITMAALTAEYEYRLARPALQPFSLGLIGSLYRPDGVSFPDGDDRATMLDVGSNAGISLGIMARFYMVQASRFSLFTEINGSLVYWEHPFPPHGTPLDGVQRFGLGFKAEVTDQWTLIGGLRQLHNSNGGKVPSHNPAYDGEGAYLGVSYVPDDRMHDHAKTKAGATARSTNARIGVEFEYFQSRQPEADQVDLYGLISEYEYRVPKLSWLALTGSMSLYRADGSRPDGNRGLGAFNAGSIGYGFNLGIRPIWQVTPTLAVFGDAIVGTQRFTKSYPVAPDQGVLYEPWTFPKSFRYGVGLRWRLDEKTELTAGYRHIKLDTSIDRPGDVPDYEAAGVCVGVLRSF